jgi:hypothetical protein
LNRSSPSSVINVHLTGQSTQEGNSHKISLPHTIASGPVPNEDYGIDLARRFLPPRLIENAEKVTAFLRKIDPTKHTGQVTREFKLNKLQLGLCEILDQAHSSSMDNQALASFLARLRIDYHQRLAEIERHVEVVDKVMENEPPAKDVPKPVLEKLSPEELKQVKEKGKRAEKRVMSNNNRRRREKQIRPRADKLWARHLKRKRRDWDKYNYQVNKKIKTVSRWLKSVPDVPVPNIPVPNVPVPFNRARMIEEQRKASSQRRAALQSSPHTVEKPPRVLTQPSNTSPGVFQPLSIQSQPSSPSILPALRPPSILPPSLRASAPSLNASPASAEGSRRGSGSARNDSGMYIGPLIHVCYHVS